MTILKGFRRPPPGAQPGHLHSPYVSSIKRAPAKPLAAIPQTISEITGPIFGSDHVDIKAFDLTKQHSSEPLGERIIVSGRVLDERSVQDLPVMANTVFTMIRFRNVNGTYLKLCNFLAPDPGYGGKGLVAGAGSRS